MGDDAATTKPPAFWKSFLSGGFGGICLVAAGHPLDLIKVRLQTQVVEPGKPPAFTGALDCARKTVAAEGIKGLYKGMVAPLMGVTPIFAVCFWAYDLGQKLERKALGYAPDHQLNLFEIGLAGGFSAIPTTAIMAPGERIKCILQIQGATPEVAPKYSGPGDVVKGLMAEGGLPNLFKGATATLLRDGFGSLAYFSAYEGIKRALTPEGSDGKLSPVAVIMGGGMAGIFNWLVAIPFDTVKSRLQTAPEGAYSGMVDCSRKLLAADGAGGFFRGVGPAMLRAFPANAACFMGVEVSMKFFNYISPP
mmetsp:Transcript_195/g.738  ORF Transcript_195/g.738 Transcript_195/m.738 type:complete len:307 (+) Transcript_195:49-969(+)